MLLYKCRLINISLYAYAIIITASLQHSLSHQLFYKSGGTYKFYVDSERQIL